MKKLITLLVLIIAIAGGAFWFITSDRLNALIAEQIQVQGTKFTEQTVTVAKVDMQLIHGAGTINGLILNNPEGYSSVPLFALNEITLDINLTSLTKVADGEPIIIDAVVINNPEALVEFNGQGGSNIQQVLDAIEKNVPKSSSTESTEPVSTTDAPRIIVKKLVLAEVALRVDLTKLGNTTHRKVLPEIYLTNIGGTEGLPANELGGELIKRSLSAIWKSAKKDQQRIIEDKLKEKAKAKIKEKVTDKVKHKAKKLLGDLF